mgnify:CR=1 FL=1
MSVEFAIGTAAAAFAFMGLAAIFAPTRVTEQFDIPSLSAAGRNEVRAVYGGFGLAICAMLITALAMPEMRGGVCLTVAAALGGMAGGRSLSAAMDRTLGGFPALYLGIETIGASMLLYAAS